LGKFTNQRRRFIKRNKNLWQKALIAILLAVFLQASITTEQASPEQASPEPAIVYEPRPLLDQVSAKEIARELLNRRQFVCLTRLIGKESAWKPKAQNPTSTASGIGQMLDSTVSSLGMKKSDSAVAQLVATLSYISRRHSTPCGAWNHFQKNRWY
jgi:hypothetical protein